MYEELNNRLWQLAKDYDGKEFWGIVDQVKRDKIKDDELLGLIAGISQKRFRKEVSFTLSIQFGNLLELALTIAAIVLAFLVNSDWMLYISALVLLTTLHPLSHYLTGTLLGIKFVRYYLNGPAKFEPTLKIDYFSYLKASAKSRALMHASGVIGTLIGPLVATAIAASKGASGVAFNLLILFLLLIVFELLTSTKTGDLMRAKREYGYK